MAAESTDLISLDEAKYAINLATTVTTYDSRLEIVVSGVSQRLVEMCGPVVNVTRTDEAYDGGDADIALRNVGTSPLVTTTVSAVKEYDSTGTLTTLSAEDFDTKPADGYLFITEDGTIARRFTGGGGYFASGYRNVLVTYTTGRAANTAAVPRKFKLAAQVCVNHVWSNLGAQSGAARPAGVDGLPFSIPPWFVPKAAIDLLHGEIVSHLGVG